MIYKIILILNQLVISLRLKMSIDLENNIMHTENDVISPSDEARLNNIRSNLTLDINNLKNKESTNKTVKLCLTILLVLMIITIIGCIIAIVIFDILALKEYSPDKVDEMCSGSGIWYYVLVSLIIIFIQIVISNENNKNSNSNLLIGIGMAIWGSIELWGSNCQSKLYGTSIYQMATIHLMSNYAGLAVLIIFGLIRLCAK